MTTNSGIFTAARWKFWPGEIFDGVSYREPGNRSNWFFFVVILLSAGINSMYLFNDLWQDELYSLRHFVFVPVRVTLTDYHSTNNHIVSNLLMSLYLKMLGVDFNTVLNYPVIVRILPFVLTLAGITFFYYCTRRLAGPAFAKVALVIYCTTLQVYTFGTQGRGYALELLLCSVHMLNLLEFVKSGKKRSFWIAGVAGGLMLINLPSTIYYYLATETVILIGLFRLAGGERSRQVFAGLTGIVGLLLCVLFFVFFPGVDQLLGNTMATPVQNSIASNIRLPFTVIYRLFDWRLLLPVLLVYATIRGQKLARQHSYSVFLLFSFGLSFVLFWLHNPEHVLRIWLVLIPLFCLLMAHLLVPIVGMLNKYAFAFYLANLVPLFVSLFFLSQRLQSYNKTNFITLDLRYQYHLEGFNPNKALQTAFRIASEKHGKVLVRECFPAGIDFYLKTMPIDSLNAANNYSSLVVYVTDCPPDSIPLAVKQKLSPVNNVPGFYKVYIGN
ncbi:MAG: hypothetical protein EOO05_05600 [Chitinophagaceae bacterium]|nr:MAG: hypothetical protein EOO05_05600 [Chitinophagaceae bacterium]